MKVSLKDYFQQEVQWLNEAMSGFGQDHPETAGRMQLDSVQDTNPTVARLLEGCAYLNARITQQIDLGAGQITESLVRRLAGSSLQPYPSRTMIECRQQPGRLIQPLTLDAGIKLQSETVGEEQTRCQFETQQPLTLQPIGLKSLAFAKGFEHHSAMELNFELNESQPFFSIQTLPFFINAERSLAAKWYHRLLRDVASIWLKQAGQPPKKIGGQERITPCYQLDSKMMPAARQNASLACRLWQDYFLFREIYHQLKLDLSGVGLSHYQFSIQIEFQTAQFEHRLTDDLFKLHCVPAVNQFSMTAEPLRYQPAQQRYPLLLSYEKKDSVRLLQLKEMRGFRRRDKRAFGLEDYYQLQTTMLEKPWYRLTQIQRDKDRVDSCLNVSALGEDEMALSCEVFAFNGHYPNQYLSASALRLADKAVPAYLDMLNLHRPTACYQPPLNALGFEQLLRLQRLDFGGLMNRTELLATLQGFDLSGGSQQKIEAIKSIQSTPFHHVRRGAVERGRLIALTLDERAFQSLAELFLFGQVLHWFFKAYAALGTLTETELLCLPSDKTFFWGADD